MNNGSPENKAVMGTKHVKRQRVNNSHFITIKPIIGLLLVHCPGSVRSGTHSSETLDDANNSPVSH